LGIGEQLIEKAIETAKQKGTIEIHVDTEENNRNAVRFYEKHGFEKIGIMFEKEIVNS